MLMRTQSWKKPNNPPSAVTLYLLQQNESFKNALEAELQNSKSGDLAEEVKTFRVVDIESLMAVSLGTERGSEQHTGVRQNLPQILDVILGEPPPTFKFWLLGHAIASYWSAMLQL